MKDYAGIWSNGNNAGAGYAVGEDNDSIDSIEDLGKLVIRSSENDGFAVDRDEDGTEVIVADANGPWAVDA